MWRFVDREIYERHPKGIRVVRLSRQVQIALVLAFVALLLLVLLLSATAGGLYWFWQRDALRLAALLSEHAPIEERILRAVAERTKMLEESRAALEHRLGELEATATRERELLRTQLTAAELHAERIGRELETLRAERAELAGRLGLVRARAAAFDGEVVQESGDGTSLGEAARDEGARRLRDRVEQLRRHLDARTLEAARARQERDRLSEQFRAALQAAERAGERQRERFEAELERMRAQNRAAAAEIAALRQAVAELQTATAAAPAADAATAEQIAKLSAERDQALERAESAEAAAITLTADLEAARRRIAELEAATVAPAAGPPGQSVAMGEPSLAAAETGDEVEEDAGVAPRLFGQLLPRPPRPAPR